MKQFAQDLLYTVLILIVILVTLDIFIPLPTNNYSVKRDFIVNHHNEIKTLAVGNSLIETGFDVEVLGDSAWCFAISGRSLYYDKELMKKYLLLFDNLETVIFGLHYNLLTHQRLDGDKNDLREEKWGGAVYIYRYYRYFHISWDTFPYGYLYRSAILSGNFHYPIDVQESDLCNVRGNLFQEFVWNGEETGGDSPCQLEINKCIEYLSSMARILHEKNVRFIVVTPPFSDKWVRGCTEEGIKELSRITDSVKSLYPLEYKNYLMDAEFRSDSLYCNWNHLNHTGATKFAQKVKMDFGL